MPRAWVCQAIGAPENLVLETAPEPELLDGHVRVQVHVAGAIFPDVLVIQNKYQMKFPPPFVPGSEVVGVVSAAAPDSAFKRGDRVLGRLLGVGGFCEEVVCHESTVMRIPTGVSFLDAINFGVNYITSLYALKVRGSIREGDRLLVLGAAGGIGFAAIELGKLLGATVLACASSDEKLALCKRMGADYLINYETEDMRARVKECCDGGCVDIVFDAVGGKYAEPAVRSLSFRGRYLVLGFAAGQIPSVPFNLFLLKEADVRGVLYGLARTTLPDLMASLDEELWAYLEQGAISPRKAVTLMPFESAPKLLRQMMDRKLVGKGAVRTRHYQEGKL